MQRYLSPAKINLFLHIVNRRRDGYHNLASLFQTISLFDQLHLALSDTDSFTCTDPTIPTDHSNLVLRAVDLFRRKTGLVFGLKIHLDKKIPVQAGLGGGSSNAATTLWALNQLLQTGYSAAELARWSSEIGSDIPFFFSLGTAYCTGRGEQVDNLPAPPQQPLWIVKPQQGLSTPSVYANVKIADLPKGNPEACLHDFSKGRLHSYNHLEQAAFTIMPTLDLLKKRLIDLGFHTVVMTGSGSGFYCLGPATPPEEKGLFRQYVNFLNRDSHSWYTYADRE